MTKKSDKHELKFPLNVIVTEYIKNQVWQKIRTTRLRHANPPWPSLAINWEEGLRERYKLEIENKAKLVAKAHANSNTKYLRPENYSIPKNGDELSERIKNDQPYFEDILMLGKDFSNSLIPGINFRNSNLSNCNFSNSILHGADFQGAKLSGINFTNCNLENANFNNAILRGANFKGAIVSDASMKNADLREVIELEYDSNYTYQSHSTPKSKNK